MKPDAFALLLFSLNLVVCSSRLAHAQNLKYAVTPNCTEVYSVETPKYVPYEETYRQRNWLGIYKWKTRVNYKLEKHISYQTRSVCCPGYSSVASLYCAPVCGKGCGPNADCAQPGYCACESGYAMDHSEGGEGECKPVCPDECGRNGYCSSPGHCSCRDGYRLLPDLVSCAPLCDCSNLEYCVEPHVCRCINGYVRPSSTMPERLDSDLTPATCKPVCERECVNADCVEPNLCRCRPGFADLDGDDFSCEPVCPSGCGANGFCSAPGVCQCHPGYDNSRLSHFCEPVCSESCVNAECIAPETCSCFDGYAPAGGDMRSHVCEPYCSQNCTHGRCTDPEVCACDPGYQSVENGTRCEPFCSQTCEMGSCTAPETCSCLDGYRPSADVSADRHRCEPVCEGGCENGVCVAPGRCECLDGYEKKRKTETHDEDDSKCVAVCECENGFCSESSSACEACAEGYELESSLNGNTSRCLPRCEGGCDHGRCVGPGVCECDENYVASNETRGPGKTENGTVVRCVRACGGECARGFCDRESNACACPSGWAGRFCEEPTLCSVHVLRNDALRLQLNESSDDPSDNEDSRWSSSTMSSVEVEEVPRCEDRCLQELRVNATRCSTRLDRDNGSLGLTCFLSIDSPCNDHVAAGFDRYNSGTSVASIVGLSTLLLLAVVSLVALAAYLFVKKRRRDKSLALLESARQIKRNEEANLIDGDGVSL